jgi:membrane-associated protein
MSALDPSELLRLLPDQLGKLLELGEPWLRQYGLSALVVGVALETFVLTGAFLPGYALVIAAGYLAAAEVLPWPLAFAGAVCGAVVGDQCSFLLGRYGTARLLRRYHQAAARLGVALEQRRIITLLLYHYSPFLRGVVPLACGHSGVRWLAFAPLSSFGALLWVGVPLSVGAFGYRALEEQANLMMFGLNLLALILLVVITVLVSRSLRAAATE